MYRTEAAEARRAHKDFSALLEAVTWEHGLSVAKRAAETVRTAVREGRLDGATYGATDYNGTQYACVLGWVDVAILGHDYFGDSPHALQVYREWDDDGNRVGSHIEDYVGGVDRGDTPATDHRAFNVARWCRQWVNAHTPVAV